MCVLVTYIKKAKSRIHYSSKSLKAETRKLRSSWTPDMSYDISQYSGIDTSVEEELINTLLKELGKWYIIKPLYTHIMNF